MEGWEVPRRPDWKEESNKKQPVFVCKVKWLTKRDFPFRSADTESYFLFHTSLVVPPY